MSDLRLVVSLVGAAILLSLLLIGALVITTDDPVPDVLVAVPTTGLGILGSLLVRPRARHRRNPKETP